MRIQAFEDAGRLLAICRAGTPEEILADVDAKRPSPPPLDERTTRALALAADDAARLGPRRTCRGCER